MRLSRGRIFVAVAGLVLAFAGAVSAGPFSVGPLVLASGASPFAPGCEGGNQSGTNYQNTEVEPWVDVNPANPANIIGVYQQDRWSTGGAHGLVAAVSHDGGATWTHTWAHLSLCAGGNAANGGDFERSSDPWVSFAPNGDAYQISISFNDSNGVNGVLVSKSTNGGDTWSEPITLARDDALVAPFFFHDKESITADPGNANYVYAVWDRLHHPGQRADTTASFHSVAFRGDAMFSRTTNGGANWEPARAIFEPQANLFTIGHQIVVLPNGTLVDIFDLGQGSGKQPAKASKFDEAVMRSTDKGVTWSNPILIGPEEARAVSDPDTGERVRTGGGLPDIAVDPGNGNLYAVWETSSFSGFDHNDIAFSRSLDGGLTWSTPIKVNATPAPVAAFTPSVHVIPDHTIAVTYYDFRNNTADPSTLPTDYWIIHSHDAGSTWGNEAHIAGPFDMKTAPVANGFFVGDYEGLDNFGNRFVPFFVQANSGNTANRTDAFFTTAGP
jgi:hypothetical protein